MTVLAIDSSSKTASCAIVRDAELIAQSFFNTGLTHSETLLPMIGCVLRNSRTRPRDIDLVAVSNGPGSFTGLRIGVATAMGFAEASGIECAGVSSLEAAARGAAHMGGLICAVMDARREQVYNALFHAENGKLTRLCEDRALALSELGAEISGKNAIVVGDGAGLCYNIGNPVKEVRYPTGYGVALAALAGHTRPADKLNYLRLPQAERERIEREERSPRV